MRILKLYLKDYIFTIYHFVANLTFTLNLEFYFNLFQNTKTRCELKINLLKQCLKADQSYEKTQQNDNK